MFSGELPGPKIVVPAGAEITVLLALKRLCAAGSSRVSPGKRESQDACVMMNMFRYLLPQCGPMPRDRRADLRCRCLSKVYVI